jgi:hypothetical protein
MKPIFQQLEDHHHKGGLCGCPHEVVEEVESDDAYRLRMAQLGREELARMRDAGLDVDPDQADDHDLAALGRSVRPARLDEKGDQLIGAEDAQGPPSPWTRYLALSQHELDHTLRQVHDHGRLREEGVDLDLDHDRIRMMGIDQTAPDDVPLFRPKILEPEREAGTGAGGDDSAPRGQSTRLDRNAKKTPMEKFLAEAMDDVQFPDDDEE